MPVGEPGWTSHPQGIPGQGIVAGHVCHRQQPSSKRLDAAQTFRQRFHSHGQEARLHICHSGVAITAQAVSAERGRGALSDEKRRGADRRDP